MFMEISVFDSRKVKLGRVQLELQFGQPGGRGRWLLQEVLEGDGWSRVSSSDQGPFDVMKDNGVIWLWDQGPGKPRNTVIIYDAPQHDADYTKTQGQARIYDPGDPALKDGWIRWTTPGLSPLRQRVLQIIGNVFPGYPGRLPIPNAIDRSTSYPKGVTNCGILPGWVARQLGYYMPWEEKIKRLKEDLTKKGLWEETKQKLKLEDREYRYKVPDSENLKVEDQKTSFTASMAAGWGLGRLEEYPIKLEQARGLRPGTIWVNYLSDPNRAGKRPLPGDIYVLQDAGGGFEHVGIIIDAVGGVWRTADCGQAGLNAAAYKKRKFDERAGTLVLDPPETNIPDAGTRWLQGWVNIDHLFAGWKP
jgi:hypothetical protein